MRVQTTRIKPQSGIALEIREGETLKVICPEGKQVSDLVAFNASDLREVLSNGKTFDYEESLKLTTGNNLFSNRSRIMLEITGDSCGIHDFLLAPCCPVTMKHFYDIGGQPPNCLDNLYEALKDRGVERWQIPTAFNIFMNVQLDANQHISVEPPTARPGDSITFLAHMDLLLGITACSAGASNDYAYGPIDVVHIRGREAV